MFLINVFAQQFDQCGILDAEHLARRCLDITINSARSVETGFTPGGMLSPSARLIGHAAFSG